MTGALRLHALTIAVCLASLTAVGWPSIVSAVQDEAAHRVSVRDTVPNDWRVEVVTEALAYPWNIERSGDRLLVTEAGGTIVVVEGGRLQRFALQTSVPVVHEGGGGLMGMALANDFAQSGTAFVYHSYRTDDGLANRVLRVRFDGQAWRESKILLDGIPGHPLYNGGRIAIGPDGHLYVLTGWTENRSLPRDRNSLAGKVLRMRLDGTVPADNPFPGSYVYSLGHRNPQGLAWDSRGQLYVAEHGQIGHDEINRVDAGGDYGWPVSEGDSVRAGGKVPLLHSGRDTWAPGGIDFAGQDLLMTALRERSLYRFDPEHGTLHLLFRGEDRLRDVFPTAGGLYLITTNRSPRGSGPSQGDKLLKLVRKDGRP